MSRATPAQARVYNRRWYESNKETRAALTKANRVRARVFVQDAKKDKPCADCGQSYPYYVMDFDHLGDKTKEVSAMIRNGCSNETLEREIAKCDLVCSNCHRERTHQRSQQASQALCVM